MKAPELTLIAIVKNEAWNIASVLNSAKPYIDSWCIMDTGSTDGTQSVVRETLGDLPGELFEAPFIDHSSARNRLIQAARDLHPGSYVLLMAGTELLIGGEKLRAALRSRLPAYNLEIHRGGLIYSLIRMFDPLVGWHFVGRTHEVLVGPAIIAPRIGNCHIIYGGGKDKTSSWVQDLELLRQDMLEKPHDARPFFYYAQTLMCLGRDADALEAFRARLNMEGWFEERYVTALYAGRLALKLGLDPQGFWRKACEIDPARAEAMFELGQYHNSREEFLESYLLAKEASRRTLSADKLFVEPDIYLWRSWDLVALNAYRFGEFTEGVNAARLAVEANPHEGRLSDNLAWYRDRVRA